MPSLSMDDILANLESYGEQAARQAGPDQLYYALLLQNILQSVTAHLAPLEQSLVMRAAIQVLGSAAEIGRPSPAASSRQDGVTSQGLLGSEQPLIPFNLG